jgi:tetratricopeptide (TPR) repeat protein
MRTRWRTLAPLLLALLLALALRLVVWRWYEFYPLGGDEQEYLQQALTLLRERRYTELRLMRPPLYGVFLAGCILLVDSLVQNLRLVQALISTATVIPIWLLTRALLRWYDPAAAYGRVAAVAALLCALSYTLAAYATELLTETLFLGGLALCLWLLLRAGTPAAPRPALHAAAAGLVLGALCLTRSVGLVLLPLGALWLLAAHLAHAPPASRWQTRLRPLLLPALLFGLGAALLIAPWSARNYATYGGLIVIDTTGAENLWLDNDPAGREAVKAQLYAMGDDRLARQQLAAQRGLEVIRSHPQHFAAKAAGELRRFFALEYTDDMRERRVIWVPPAQVAARLLLGDGLWLLTLLAGVAGFCLPLRRAVPQAGMGWLRRVAALFADPRWLLGAWAAYILLTGLLFHVELRYRLPLYPVLLPCAALALVALALHGPRFSWAHWWRWGAGGLLLASMVTVMLLHRPYPQLVWQLAAKHLHLARAAHAIGAGDSRTARNAAQAALTHDPASVLARVALAQAALQTGDEDAAAAMLRAAIDELPDHPLPHLLLGDLLRQQGQPEAARAELAYETASLQDLQAWGWQHFGTPPPRMLDIGGGLDLGHIRGFHPAEIAAAPAGRSWRWTTGEASVRLHAPAACHPGAETRLHMRLAAGRPPNAPPSTVTLWANGQLIGQVQVPSGDIWHSYTLPFAVPSSDAIIITLRSETFVPRAYQPTSNDGRRLGVMLAQIRLQSCTTTSFVQPRT